MEQNTNDTESESESADEKESGSEDGSDRKSEDNEDSGLRDTSTKEGEEDNVREHSSLSNSTLQIGLPSQLHVEKDTTLTRLYPSSSQTPVRPVTSSQKNSPNALLAQFFRDRGDAPLSLVEKEGVIALLSKTDTRDTTVSPTIASVPSYATPARNPYQPIFTPVRMPAKGKPVPATEVKKIRRPNYLSAASPFRRRKPPTSFGPPQPLRPPPSSVPRKYELSSVIVSDETAKDGKRGLDEVNAPEAKRTKTEASGTRTAASILEILESTSSSSMATKEPENTNPEQLKTMLNPYASSSTPRKPSNIVRRTPVRSPVRRERSALEEIDRSLALERKGTTYLPKKSSGLANSFSASEPSLFSPKTALANKETVLSDESTVTNDAEKRSQNGVFSFGTPASKQAIAPTTEQATEADSIEATTSGLITNERSGSTESFGANQSGSVTTAKFIAPDSHTDDGSAIQAAPEKLNTSSLFSFGTPAASSAASFAPTEQDSPPSTFGFGSACTDGKPSKPHGGFSFGSSQTTIQASSETTDAVPPKPFAAITTKITPAFSFGLKPSKDNADTRRAFFVEENIQTPAKAILDPQAEEAVTARNTGFVFRPTHTKSTSSFSFSNYAPLTEEKDVPQPGFMFDPGKQVDIFLQPKLDKPFAPLVASTTLSKTEPNIRSRVLSVYYRQSQIY